MNPSRCAVFRRALVPLLLLLSVAVARAQGEIGPAAVWWPGDTFATDVLVCSPAGGCTLSRVMAAHGASAEAVAFTQAREESYYLSAFTELGRVDLGLITMPNTASGIGLYEMLNGNPSPVSAEDVDMDEMRALPAYAALWARHPNLVLWAQTIFDGMEAQPDGGQRFLFSYPMLDGCRACPEIDKARAAFDFDAAGNFLGVTYLDPASTAPIAAQPTISTVATGSSVATSSLGQIAYTLPADGPDDNWGDIRIIDLDGSTRPITNSGADCCAAWSPDGTRLYFIRNIDGEAAPHSIIEMDMISGEERAIGPQTTLAKTLAVSPDGKTLAFVINSPMPPPPPDQFIMVDNMACLNLLDLGSGDIIEIDCLEESFFGGLEFNPHEPTLITGVGGMEWAQIYVYDLFTSEPTPFQGVCCFEPEWSPSDIRLYTLGNYYYMYETFNAAGIDGWAIFEQGQGQPGPLPVLSTVDPIGSFDLSPDGQMIAYERMGRVEVAMLGDRSAPGVYLTDGVKPVWRPGDPAGWADRATGDGSGQVAAADPVQTAQPEPPGATTAGQAVAEDKTATPPAPDSAQPAAVAASAVLAGGETPTTAPPPAARSNSGSNGVLMGIIVTAAAAVLFGIIAYLTRRKA